MTDFRYEKNGRTIEAFQMTSAARYQQKDWPEWMDSHWLMTVDDQEWLNYNDKESIIPSLGWICQGETGVFVLDAMEMEKWVKVVQEAPPVIHPPADRPDVPVLASVTSLVPEVRLDSLAIGTGDLMNSITQAIVLLKASNDLPQPAIEAEEILVKAMLGRVAWCDCAPGRCEGVEILGCRHNSPLV
jgi:hypothetical protein